jgi:hypothetical protein
MPEFIFMLTKDDRTVPDALEAYRRVKDVKALRYVGFKDIGLPLPALRQLAAEIRGNGHRVMLEVVSVSEAEELRSVHGAIEIGVDYLLGGRQAEAAVRLLASTGIKYFPFCGRTIGHPTQLRGSVEEIVDDARRLAGIPGVHGLDLLAYRFDGDVERLAERVVAAVPIPVIAAGSIDRVGRIEAMRRSGVWGFTVGSAVFEGRFVPDGVRPQVEFLAVATGAGGP